ncbi:MAG: acyl-ACP--UDP-N-acetylglucosamine O-acyltransferase [Bacteroidales bacterium]|jgi:UDP-N-acetylglucosamine acyltransferase|nr:acyl-ACP--UDP-N-acetylglucosamine O-acyltransferase [Bacteroidales bacterium]
MKSELAYIHLDAKLGENVTVEPFAYSESNVVIGDGTRIRSGARILDGSRIGKNCDIHPGAVIAGIPQDLKFVGEETTAEVGDNSTIRECATINRGTKARGKTTVGKDCLLMAYTHIAHDCEIGDKVIIGNTSQIAGEVKIGDNSILSAVCLVHQFVHIGRHVMIQGGTKISKDVPPYIIAAREPLVYSGLNVIGLRRRGFTNEQVREIQDVYRYLYQRGMNNTDACDVIESDLPMTDEREEILGFVRSSKRGVIKGYTTR